MIYLKELPDCNSRFGRTDIDEISNDNGVVKKIVRMILCCGYRETDVKECISCGGFVDVILEIDTFMMPKKGRMIKLDDTI